MKSILVILLLFSRFANAQSNYEQLAFNYFFDKIGAQEEMRIEFSGKTETATSGAFTTVDCIDSDERMLILNNGFKEAQSVGIDSKDYFKKRKNCGKKKWSMSIYRGFKTDDKIIVLISLNQKRRRTNDYYIILNESSQVVDWCKIESIH
jgi:hypothetical protein